MVANNRRSRRARRIHAAPRAESRPAAPATPAESPEQLSQRLENLRGEIAAAKADAERRTDVGETAGAEEYAAGSVAVATAPPELTPPHPRPDTDHRGRKWVAGGTLLALAVVGVVVGLLVTQSGGHSKNSKSSPPLNPVASYMKQNVPAGASVGVVGATQGLVPSGYTSHAVTSTSTINQFKYVLAPDPLSQAGPAMTTYIEKHATLLAVAPSQATLWVLNVAPGVGPSSTAPPASSTTVRPSPTTAKPAASTTTAPAPSTTAPKAPSTTAPKAPVATLPPVTAPATTAPPATVPPTTAPKAPSATAPKAPSTSAPANQNVVVQSGESFWLIAQSVLQQRLGTTPTNAQIAQYWTQLINANAHNLPHPGNPDLIYVGQTLVVPSG